jgi:Ca-activated chloride channel family protein
MDDQPKLYNTTRRQILAGMGAVGLASAGAGLGTTAYFSDTESFSGNTLEAGTLDLKLDYKSTYMGGSGRLDAVKAMGYPDAEDLGDGRYLLGQAPTPEEMEAWEDLVTGEDIDFCGPGSDDYLVNGDGIPVFTLEDIKPGDSGEVTISLHICDNPAWVTMNGSLYDNLENGMTEPEMEAADTNAGAVGELADEIEVCVWYDEDCDNVYEPTGTGQQQELEIALVSDTSGSMSQEIGDLKTAAKDFVDNLSSPDEAAAVSFANGASLDQALTTNYQAVKDAIDQYIASGGTDMDDGITVAENELLTGANATAGASKVMIVLSDGEPSNETAAETAAQAARDAGIRIFTIALGSGADEAFLEGIATSPDDAFVAPDSADLDTVYGEIAQIVLAGEQKIASGTMAEVFELLAEGIDLDGDRQEEGVQCFPGATTQCVGFEWELPAEVGNEVQTDSLAFDVGFDAEQCRHNEREREITTSTGDGFLKQEEFDAQVGSAFARGRFGDNLAAGAWEVALGTPGSPTPNILDQANYVWTPGDTVPFGYTSDGMGNATFTLDGNSVSGAVPTANGKLGITTKADEATITVENLELDLAGETVALDGPTMVSASNDDATTSDDGGREVSYLVIETAAADVAGAFEIRGDVTVDVQGDFPGGDEDIAFDVSIE